MQCTIVLAVRPPNTTQSSSTLRTQKSHSHEIAETLLEDDGRWDGRKRVVLFQEGINQIYLGTAVVERPFKLRHKRIPYDGVDSLG